MRRRLANVLGVTLLGAIALIGSGCGSKQAAPAASSPPPDLGLTAASCRQLIDLPVTFTDAVTGLAPDLDKTHAVLRKFARKSPAQLRPEFVTLTAASAKITAALDGVDLTSSTVPRAVLIGKLRKLSAVVDTAKVTQASADISDWAQANCSAARSPGGQES